MPPGVTPGCVRCRDAQERRRAQPRRWHDGACLPFAKPAPASDDKSVSTVVWCRQVPAARMVALQCRSSCGTLDDDRAAIQRARTTSTRLALAAATSATSRARDTAARGYAAALSLPSLPVAAFDADRRREDRGASSITTGFAAAHASLPARDARFSRRRAVCSARPSRQLLHAI